MAELVTDLTQGITQRLIKTTRTTRLSDLIPSTIFDLDVTLSDSNAVGSQSWFNRSIPADAEAQSAYDHFLGATSAPSTDDPTRVGENNDPAAHFLYDGGDRNRIIGSNTAKINSMGRTDNTDGQFSFAIALFWPTAITTGDYFLAGTSNSTSDHGVRFSYDRSNERFEFIQTSGGTQQITNIGSGIILNGAWNLIAIDIEKTSGTDGTATARLNNDAPINVALTTFGASLTDPADKFQISGVAGSAELPNGSRVAAASMFNAVHTGKSFADLAGLYKIRQNRDYLA